MGFLDLNTTQQFLPRFDLDLRAGRFFAVERTQGADGEWTSEKIEVESPSFGVDIGNTAIGYTAFIDNRPDSIMHHQEDGMPAQPSPEHKPGFEVTVKLIGGDFDGSVRKFGKQGLTIGRAFDELVDAWQAHKNSKDKTKVPVIQVTGSTAIKVGRMGSQNYAPKWGIAKWIARPEEFDQWIPQRIDVDAERAKQDVIDKINGDELPF